MRYCPALPAVFLLTCQKSTGPTELKVPSRPNSVLTQSTTKKVAARPEPSFEAPPSGCGNETFVPVSSVDEPPVVAKSQPPRYRESRNRTTVSGVVVILVYIRASGDVCAVTLVKGVAPEFDNPIRHAVAAWKFKPGKKAGRAVGCVFEMTVNLNLRRPN
jgi:protein TonB